MPVRRCVLLAMFVMRYPVALCSCEGHSTPIRLTNKLIATCSSSCSRKMDAYQATPGYLLIHHVPPMPACLSNMRNWSKPSCCFN
jgi:hypothetical protein